MKAYVALPSFSANQEAMELLSKVTEDIIVRKEVNRPNKSELMEIVTQYEILIIGVKEKMDKEIYEKANKLKFLCTLSIGTDHIDKSFFTSSSIKVVSCNNANVLTVAEFAFAYIISNLKSFQECNHAFRTRKGREGIQNMPTEIGSKVIGVIGAGRIAYSFFNLTNSFSFKRLCWTFNPEKHEYLSDKYNVEFTSLSNLIELSDYIIILIPYTEQTHYLLSDELLAKSKRTAKFVNVSRLNIIDNNSFFNKLEDGYFVGSLIDCFPDEISDDQLVKISDKINFSPHVAGISIESRKRMSSEVAQKLLEYVL